MSRPRVFDIIVLGAGPAGSAAALFAAQKGLDAALIEQNKAPPKETWTEWFNPAALNLLKGLGVSARDFVLGTLETVRFVDLQHDRETSVSLRAKGKLAHVNQLSGALWRLAENGIGSFSKGARVRDIEAGEDYVCLTSAEKRVYSGRILIIADGVEAWAARRLGLFPEPAIGGSMAPAVGVQWIRQPSSLKIAKGAFDLTLFFESAALGDFAYICQDGVTTVAGAIARASRQDARALLHRAIKHGCKKGVLTSRTDVSEGQIRYCTIPRGAALDLESHVAKRSILIGDAGGFVPALGERGLYAALWSARLAVEVAFEALRAEHPQDALVEFDRRWRGEMVDYLRLPNVDLRFLLPLIFTNERMAERLAQAFLCGENL